MNNVIENDPFGETANIDNGGYAIEVGAVVMANVGNTVVDEFLIVSSTPQGLVGVSTVGRSGTLGLRTLNIDDILKTTPPSATRVAAVANRLVDLLQTSTDINVLGEAERTLEIVNDVAVAVLGNPVVNVAALTVRTSPGEQLNINANVGELVVQAGAGSELAFTGEVNIARINTGGGSRVTFGRVGGANVTQGEGSVVTTSGSPDAFTLNNQPLDLKTTRFNRNGVVTGRA